MALSGIKVVEMLGLAPGPFCGTILADFGAQVTVVHKIGTPPLDVMSHGKRMLSVNLKSEEGIEIVKRVCSTADVLIDTFRPGVLEKLGLGPETLMKDNSRLICARLSGYGQHGFYKDKAGHDINYVSMSGVLSLLRKKTEPPSPPLNLLADFGGGSLTCVLGILLALFERSKSGKGQIIDSSMCEGASYLATWVFKSKALPIWSGEPGSNVLDGGVSFYCTYKTKDGKFMAVGALEPQFYSQLMKGLNLSEDEYSQMGDQDENKKKFQEVFLTKTREEWIKIFEELDACVTPVLDSNEVANHTCNKSRNSFYEDLDGTVVPEPAPKLSRTPGESVGKQLLSMPGQHTKDILKELDYSESQIRNLAKNGHIYFINKPNL